MRILITGARGQLGTALTAVLSGNVNRDDADCEVVGIDLPELDLTDAAAVRRVFREIQPAIVVNTAAYTLVDQAEEDRDRCSAINDHAVATFVELCNESDALLCQLSTDYVFGCDAKRSRPYIEDDIVGPINFYGQSKAASEQNAHRCRKHLIVRTCGLYGTAGDATAATNFVDRMIELGQQRDQLGIVNDQSCSPSYVPHVARAIAYLLHQSATGIYHVVNSEAATWYDFATEIFQQTKIDVRVDAISTEAFGAPAARPRYSVLDNSKYLELGGPPLPSWREALAEYLATKVNSPAV